MTTGQDIDVTALAAWMDGCGLPPGPIGTPTALLGGTQNVMLRFERGGAEYVFRRGPWHLRPGSNDAIRREIRALTALRGTDVPHPRVIAACPDGSALPVTGGEPAAFYLMELVGGFNPIVGLPALHAGDRAVRREMGFAAVDAAAALGAVDHVRVGLGDFGRPEGYLERQVPRWTAHLESYRSEVYPEPDVPGLAEVTAWLTEHRPASFEPGILHGDFHLSNLLFRPDGPQVAAIVDWEMVTIGDPLLDLGWLLATLPTDEPGIFRGAAVGDGLPGRAELVERYARRSTRDLSHATWYEVLAAFRLAIILEGTWVRSLSGKAPAEVGQRLHEACHALFQRALLRIAAP